MTKRKNDVGVGSSVPRREPVELSEGHAHSAHHAGGRFDLVVIAASVGGVTAIGDVLSALPADFPIPIAVVLHRSAKPPGILEKVLARRTPLVVKAAEQFEPMRPGVVYLAPPDLHLNVHDGNFVLTDGRKIRYVLSSANPLFASAAEALAGRVVAVVLTVSGRDGTDGVQTVKAHGGIVIAQDETTSEHFGMPSSAIETRCVDRVYLSGRSVQQSSIW